MTETARLALPLLEPGQAQKEWFHNEALALLDIAVQPAVEGIADTPPAAPEIGACWIVDTEPNGAWVGRGGCIAGWTDAGWRFVKPREGMAAWSLPDATAVRRRGGAWLPDRVVPIAPPEAGTVVDVEARTAIGAILAAMQARGWLA